MHKHHSLMLTGIISSALLVALIMATARPAAAQTTCTNQLISVTTNNSAGTVPHGVNKYDTVVGLYLNNSTFQFGAFRWHGGHIATYQVPNSVNTTFAGINDQGVISGSYKAQSGRTHGLLFYQGHTFTVDFPSATFTAINGINNSRTIAGAVSNLSGTGFDGFYKTSGGAWHRLRFPGARDTDAQAISNTGVVAGFYVDATGLTHGFTFANGIFHSVNFPGAGWTEVHGINRYGTLVGLYRTSTTNTGPVIAFTDRGGVFRSYSYPGAQDTTFEGISDLGDRSGSLQFSGSGPSSAPGFIRICR